MNTSTHGALPPPALRWSIGKTAASIRFVTDAQVLLHQAEDGSVSHRILERMVQHIKDGYIVLNRWISPQEFLSLPPSSSR